MEEEKVVDQTVKTSDEIVPEEVVQETKKVAPDLSKGERKPRDKHNVRRNGPRGFDRNAPKEFEERIVYINRISKTVKGGRRMRFSALVVIGDGKGRYGFANAKAAEVPDAIKKSLEAARKNLHTIAIVKNTLPHEIVGKYGACKVFLKPAPEGTGIIAGGPVRAILELAGVKNVYSKIYGSRAAVNIIRATNDAIANMKSREVVKKLRSN